MTFLVDTNVISEIRKGRRCDPQVARWYASVEDEDLYPSALAIGEIRKGIERARDREPAKALALERWLGDLLAAFDGYILAVDQEVAEEWGRMCVGRSRPVIDTLQAATAKVHGLTIVTRNVDDVEGTGAQILNPFNYGN